MDWSTAAHNVHQFVGNWPGIVQVFLIVLAVLIINAILHRITTRLASRAGRARRVWAEGLLGSISAPLQVVIWIIGLSVAVKILVRQHELSMLAEIFPPARNIAIIAVITWFLIRAVCRVQSNLMNYAKEKGHELDPTATDAISKLLRAAIVITAALVAMQTLGVSIAGLLAFGGIGGIAIGFAAQGLVANLFGGLTIYASRPFKVGDYIIMPDNNLMGQVQHIGWRATRVMGFDRMPFYVPNAMFNTAVVVNQSRMTNRRILEKLHLRYRDRDKVRSIVAEVNQMLVKHPGIEHDFFVFRFDTCGDYALQVLLYAFTVSTVYTEYMSVKEDILLKVADIVEQHDCELAVPVSTIYAPEGIHLKPGVPPMDPAAAGLLEPSTD